MYYRVSTFVKSQDLARVGIQGFTDRSTPADADPGIVPMDDSYSYPIAKACRASLLRQKIEALTGALTYVYECHD